MAKKKGHGGPRPGSGPKPTADGSGKPVTVWLTAALILRIVEWQDAHDCESFSEALRQMIDAASP